MQLSVDDFGTGYASLSYLKKLPIDIVKIDQSFIKDLVRERHDRRIVEAVATLARELGAKTVAEGVETKAQLELLREIGCDYAQGFLFSPAISPESIISLVNGGFDGTGLFVHADKGPLHPGKEFSPGRRRTGPKAALALLGDQGLIGPKFESTRGKFQTRRPRGAAKGGAREDDSSGSLECNGLGFRRKIKEDKRPLLPRDG